jgi:hypothetical protein
MLNEFPMGKCCTHARKLRVLENGIQGRGASLRLPNALAEPVAPAGGACWRVVR